MATNNPSPESFIENAGEFPHPGVSRHGSIISHQENRILSLSTHHSPLRGAEESPVGADGGEPHAAARMLFAG